MKIIIHYFENFVKVCELYGCEMNCGQSIWKCDSGHEIFKHRYCDGEADCVDGSDEADCESGCCDFLRLDFKNSELGQTSLSPTFATYIYVGYKMSFEIPWKFHSQ